jgi:penicillin-binding protein 1C
MRPNWSCLRCLWLVVGSILAMPVLCAPRAFAEVRAGYTPSERTLVDRHGAPLQTLRIDSTVRRLEWVPLERISPVMLRVLVAAEDQRFFEHGGVDWNAVAHSALENLSRTRPRGASTISMQVAALLDSDLAPAAGQRSVGQKVSQAIAAQRLESVWTKAQILEAYLNLVTFRGELQGIGAAAQALFGKSADALAVDEAVLLAVLVRQPNARAHAVASAACALLSRVQGQPTCFEIKVTAGRALAAPYRLPPAWNEAPHFARRALKGHPDTLRLSLDGAWQRLANSAVRRHLGELSSRNVRDAAVVVLDNTSGEVRVHVGGSGSLSAAPELDMARAPRQAGSTLKPFLYALAIDARLLTAASPLADTPAALRTASGLYTPRNYDRVYRGTVSLRTALASSLNVPAVRAAEVVGTARLHGLLSALGLELANESADFYSQALALGGADVSLLQLTNAYRMLANAGRYGPVGMPPASAALSAGAAYIIGDVLSDRGARAITFGTDSVLATRIWSAVKTGTSKDMRDNWCVGWGSRYTVGVWVGNADGSPMREVSGVAGAAPIWAEIMHAVHRDAPAGAPALAPGVVRQRVMFSPGFEAVREELFLIGTERAQVVAADPSFPRIAYPTHELVVALDPDIPPARQRVPIDIEGWRDGYRLLLDGAPLSVPAWAPKPGRHTLRLLDVQGAVLDEVVFEVRASD